MIKALVCAVMLAVCLQKPSSVDINFLRGELVAKSQTPSSSEHVFVSDMTTNKQYAGFRLYLVEIGLQDIKFGVSHQFLFGANIKILKIHFIGLPKFETADFMDRNNSNRMMEIYSKCRRVPKIFDVIYNSHLFTRLEGRDANWRNAQVSSGLSLSHFSRNTYSVLRGFGGASSEIQRPEKRYGANENEQSLPLCIIGHPLRCRIHALLGDKVSLLVIAGFILCALAGTGGFIGFDDHNGKRHRKIVGRGLLFIGGPLGLLLAFLGLP